MATDPFSVVPEGPWAIGGAIAATIAAVVATLSAAYEFLVRPTRRRHKLKRPCVARFTISSSEQRIISYAVQDKHEHHVEELTLAAHSEFEIEVLYWSKIDFAVSEIYFGCGEQDYHDLEGKPIIKSHCNLFIERGTKEESPETHPETNATDRHKFYHIKNLRVVAKNETYSLGFKIQTHEPGKYDFNLFFVGEEVGRLKNKLVIRVEERPVTRMRCVLAEHRWAGCFIQPAEIHS
jgi:hypothetical protein